MHTPVCDNSYISFYKGELKFVFFFLFPAIKYVTANLIQTHSYKEIQIYDKSVLTKSYWFNFGKQCHFNPDCLSLHMFASNPLLLSYWHGIVYRETQIFCLINIRSCLIVDITSLHSNSRDAHTLHWRHNERDSVSNHQLHGCLLNRLFRRRSKKTPKLHVTGLCVGTSPGPVNSPTKGQLRGKCFHLMTSSWQKMLHDLGDIPSNWNT